MSIKTVKTVRNARYVVAFSVAAFALGASASTQAADLIAEVGPAKTVVSYADLDLSKVADARSLYVRLQRASNKVCGKYEDVRNLRMKRISDVCYQQTMARAVDSVGHATLSAVYAADERIHIATRPSKALASS
jgi:UrcA family protein